MAALSSLSTDTSLRLEACLTCRPEDVRDVNREIPGRCRMKFFIKSGKLEEVLLLLAPRIYVMPQLGSSVLCL